MVSQKEKAGIRRFVVKQLRDESDLSTLTLGILKKRYLANVNCDSLSPEAKKFMKQVVEEELLKMQEKYESDTEIKKPQNKRKREKEQEVESEEEKKESRTKKSRSRVSSSSSDSEDDEDHKTESPKQIRSHSKDAKKEARKPDQKVTKNTEQQITSDDSSDEKMNGSEESDIESNESPEVKVKKKANTPKKEETRSAKTSGGKETQESDKESENDSDSKSESNDKSNDSGSSDDEKGKKVLVQKKTESSSPPSLEDENKSGSEDAKSKKKKTKKDHSSQSQKGDDKAIVRLKRYISLCGVRRNYKKLLDGCRSTRSKVAVLKKELEDLGVHGNPSIDKCKKVRMKREEAEELAELDVGNIITTQGRPKRRGISTRQDQQDPPSSTYQRALNSGSESEENNPDKRCKKMNAWANLRGIISDDADSD